MEEIVRRGLSGPEHQREGFPLGISEEKPLGKERGGGSEVSFRAKRKS